MIPYLATSPHRYRPAVTFFSLLVVLSIMLAACGGGGSSSSDLNDVLIQYAKSGRFEVA